MVTKSDQTDVDEKNLLLTKTDFNYNNKECFAFSITDLTSLKQVSKLRNKNSLLELLASNVSHEMMTPLNCMIYLADKLVAFLIKDNEKSQIARLIKNSANMMKFQVKDLLDRSLLGNKALEPNYTT